ncbi:MAG: AAA family ATPase, partial [Caldilinea sp.]
MRTYASPAELARIKASLRTLYEAGPGAKGDDLDLEELDHQDDDDEGAAGAYIPIPTETFLEELSVKLQIHPISVYWLLEELRAEGVRCKPEEQRLLEDRLSVLVLRLLGHRWPRQIEAGEPVPAWADTDGVIPLTPHTGEPTLADRVSARLRAEEGDLAAQRTEALLQELTGRTLAEWLRRDFFKRHISQFKKRPIAWHLTSGGARGGGRGSRKRSGGEPAFECMVYYHRTDTDILARIRTQYVERLLERERGAVAHARRGDAPNETAIAVATERIRELEEFAARLRAVEEQGFACPALDDLLAAEPLDRWSGDGVLPPADRAALLAQEQAWRVDINDGSRQRRAAARRRSAGKRRAGGERSAQSQRRPCALAVGRAALGARRQAAPLRLDGGRRTGESRVDGPRAGAGEGEGKVGGEAAEGGGGTRFVVLEGALLDCCQQWGMRFEKGTTSMWIESITLDNIKCFEQQEIKFTQNPNARGQRSRPYRWITLLGENGVGKSTILQALGLLLAGPEAAKELAPRPTGWARDERAPGALKVVLHKEDGDDGVYGEDKVRTTFSYSMFVTGSTAVEVGKDKQTYTEPALIEESTKILSWLRANAFASGNRGWFAVGYGAFRRLTRVSQVLIPSLDQPKRSSNFITQFNEDAPLSSFERWMVYLDYRLAKDASDDKARQMRRVGEEAITALLPGDVRIEGVTKEGLIQFAVDGQRVATVGLSDGFRSVIALAGDLIWRLLQAFPDLEDPTAASGVVLIDELDIHLHPSWQRE